MEGFAGKVAAVTGAGSGIGQALALELARSGASVAISDVDTEGLAQTEEQLKAIGAPVRSDRLDVTEREAFHIYADQINEHFGKVNQIYNNAGIAYTGDVEITQYKDIERVMDVDFWGVVNGTKAFLPHLIASGDGHIINVSSVAGHKVRAGSAVYAATKSAVRVISEGLRQEVKPYDIRTTVISPGAVDTELTDSITEPDVAQNIKTFYAQVAISADSFARAVAFAISQPPEVDINEILYRPTRQEF